MCDRETIAVTVRDILTSRRWPRIRLNHASSNTKAWRENPPRVSEVTHRS